MSAPNADAPSMVSGHAQYAKGYVEETVGNVLGSKDWQESGKAHAQEGINEMKAANAARTSEPAASGLGGKVEEFAGKAAGCEGMEKEGLVRQEKATTGDGVTSSGLGGVQSGSEGLVKQDESAK